jgi:hypothetical protein
LGGQKGLFFFKVFFAFYLFFVFLYVFLWFFDVFRALLQPRYHHNRGTATIATALTSPPRALLREEEVGGWVRVGWVGGWCGNRESVVVDVRVVGGGGCEGGGRVGEKGGRVGGTVVWRGGGE